MDNKNLYILLKIIKNNSSVKQLIREGLNFSKIADITSEAIKEEYIIQENENIILTKKGLEKLYELELEFKNKNKAEWIEKDKKNQVKKIDINDIFLPSKDNLSF